MTLDFIIDSWVDAQELHRSYPDKFDVPNNNELDELKTGNLVKICNGKERFWVELKEINDSYLIGRIDNELCTGINYDKNSIIMFEKKNIYSIYDNDIENIIKTKLLNHAILCKHKNN